MQLNRRQALATGLAVAGAGWLPGAQAQGTYPSGVIKFIIPTAVGGGYDIMMRVIGQKLTEAWGQPCIVEARTGASGSLAAQAVAKAAPDGQTLMVGYSALVSNQLLQKAPGYKLADFVPVSMLTISPIALGVRESLGVKSLKELIALAKSKPGRLSYGSYGPGSGGHFVGEQLKVAAGVHITHLPYRGEAPAIQDLLSEQIDMAIVTVGGVTRYPGKIRPLAVCSPSRFPLYPDIPTFAQSGYPAVDMAGWGGLFAPAGTPPAVVAKIAAEVNRIIKLPDVSAKILELGFEPVGWAPDRVNKFMSEQLASTKKLVDAGRIQL
ncbi:MAG: Bug family tripartite tricarboxylate transporter substrate binding protein [Ramlibacter sp.]